MRRLLSPLVIVFVAACVGPGTASPSSATSAPSGARSMPWETFAAASPKSMPTPTPSLVVPAPSPWPAVGKAPAPDKTPGLYLAYDMFDDIYGLVDSLVISSDGRVVIENTVWRPGPFVTRRLNESGLAFVRAELAVVGLFDKSQDRKIVHDRDCCGGVRGDQVTVVSGGKTVEVGEVALKAGSYADSAEWDRFEALVKHLAAPDSWIPASGWADAAWRPFHAPTFCMILRRDVVPYSVLLHTADLAWPPGVRPFASYGVSAVPGQDPDDRLGIITAAEAYALAASISQRATAASVSPDDFDLVPLSDGGWLNSPDIDDPDGGNPITVYLRPVSPGVTACQVLR